MIFILLSIALHLSDGANILIHNPTIGQSHIRFLGNMADTLSRAGHNVTVLSVEIDPLLHPFGTQERNVHKIHVPVNTDPELYREIHTNIQNVWSDKEIKPFQLKEFELFFDSLMDAYKVILNNGTLMDSLKNSKFDVAIHEYYEIGSVALMEAFGISKTILASAIGDVAPYTYDITGIPTFTSFVPIWATIYDDQMGFWERVDNMEKTYELRRFSVKMEAKVQEVFEQYIPKNTDIRTLFLKKSGMILANVNEFTQTPRPISSMIQFVGGGHLYPTKPLKKELSDLLNERKYNVLFSLGTFVRICESPIQIKKLFAEAFSSLKDVTFIVKYENCTSNSFDFNSYENIVAKTWLPQTDLLGDDRIHLFITHGVKVGSTLMIDRRFISKEHLADSIRSLLDSQKYLFLVK
ncbi:unnamed protein product [Auanema sp. JU1783]|nr:unnamed protein product [Auanema sp. JU1783]